MLKNNVICLLDEISKETKVNKLFIDRYKNRLAPKFSIFNYFSTNELVLSNILADLLDPNGSHGQDLLFIQTWFNLNQKTLDEKWKKIDLKQSSIKIKLEEKNWRLDTLRRMDILIEISVQGEKFGLCIENKPFANDQKDQLNDYALELETRYGNQWHLIYLSGYGQDPTEKSISGNQLKKLQEKRQLSILGYADLLEWLSECIVHSKNERVRVFLEELKLYISQTFITKFNIEEQQIMLNTIINNNDHIKALIEVETLKSQLQEQLLSKLKEDISALCDDFIIEGELTANAYSGISIYKEDISKKIRFRMEFDRSKYGIFFLGITLADLKNTVLTQEERQKVFKLTQDQFPTVKMGQSLNWPVFIDIPELLHWQNNGDIWVSIKDGSLAERIYSEFFLPLNEIIRRSNVS